MTNCFQTPKSKVYQPKPTTVENHLQNMATCSSIELINYVCKQAVCPKQCAQVQTKGPSHGKLFYTVLVVWKMNIGFGILILPCSAKEI
jgi:hypothetical protein